MELFGVGIGEAALVLVLALIVLGPERFPQIAREAGRWYRTARRFAAEVTTDLQGAIQELEDEVNEQSGGGLKSVRELGNEVRTGVRDASADVRAIGEGVGTTVRKASPDTPSTPAVVAAAAAGTALVAPTSDATPAPAEPAEAKVDPFELVRRSYANYHTPSSPPPPADPPELTDPDAMSAHALEAFSGPHTVAAPVEAPAPTAVAPTPEAVSPSNGASSSLLTGVNPFPSAVPPSAPVPASSGAPTETAAADEGVSGTNDAASTEGAPPREGAPAWPVKRAAGKTSTAPAADRSGA